MSAGQQAVPANNANNASNEGAQKKHMSKAGPIGTFVVL